MHYTVSLGYECKVCDSTLDAIPGLFDKPEYGHHLGWEVCQVHFHSIEVARFLFPRWRAWAHWTRASRLTQLVPFCLVVVQVVGPIIPISG